MATIEESLARISADLRILKWMVGVSIAMSATAFAILLRGSAA